MNMMIDVETLSTQNNAVILSIGAVVFDTRVKATFSAVASDPDDQAKRGAHVQPSTALWWMKQSEDARQQFHSGIPTIKLLEQVSELYSTMQCNAVWSYGSNFDICVMENLFSLYKVPVPWTYKHVRCFRTLMSLFPDIEKQSPSIAHDALSDAMAQANTCIRVLGLLT